MNVFKMPGNLPKNRFRNIAVCKNCVCDYAIMTKVVDKVQNCELSQEDYMSMYI